jgi:spermidine/putrescine transport system substrate-binding protein
MSATNRDVPLDSNGYTPRQRGISRRQFLATAGGATVTASALGGCLGDGGGSTKGSTGNDKYADSITFYSTGGSWARKLEREVLKPFEEKFGVTVNLQTYGDPSAMLAKIKAGQVDLDAMLMTEPPLYQGIKDGIWGPLRKENIPNLDRLRTFKPTNVPYDPGERIHHVPNTYGAYGMVYNTQEFDSEPKTWQDLYSKRLDGKLTLSQFMSPVVGTAALDLGYKLNEFVGDQSKVKKVWNRVRKQDKYMYQWWNSATTAQQLYTNRAALAGNFWYGRTYILRAENGVPVKYTLPKNGAVGYVSVWTINADIEDPKRYTCETLFNYILSNEPSRRLAKAIPYAQANKIDNPPKKYDMNPDANHPELVKIWDQSLVQKHEKEWSEKLLQVLRGG